MTATTRPCKHCKHTLEWAPGIGWVDALSGDEGGAYDRCPASPLVFRSHAPEEPFTAVSITEETMRSALADATIWANPENGSPRAEYWQGMRDTLQVMLGLTVEPPSRSGPDADAAAILLLREAR